MDVAVIGATGSCGRQCAVQLIARGVLQSDAPKDVYLTQGPGSDQLRGDATQRDARLHLIGHAGGAHESELWGLRADLRDAFDDSAPTIEVGTDVAATGADLVVMMAGATVTRDTTDRAALAATNRRIFAEAAEAVGSMRDAVVVVQSNPVELAIQAFARWVPRHRLIGAAAWSDSLRLRRELAADLGVRRPMVQAQMWGQHGDHLVPMWSKVQARGVSEQHLADVIGAIREGRSLLDLPHEIQEAKARTLELIRDGDTLGALLFIQERPPDVRAAVKPFFIHFTAGRTTELATAHSVVDVVEFIARGLQTAIPAQVMLEGEYGGLTGPIAVPVLTDPTGWSTIVNESIAPDEQAALLAAAAAITAANADS